MLWRFLRDRLNLQQPTGVLDLGGNYRFSLSKGSPALSVDALHAKLSDVALRLRESKTPILELDRVEVSKGTFDLSPTVLELGRVSVVKGNLRVTVAEDGKVDWQRIILPRPGLACTLITAILRLSSFTFSPRHAARGPTCTCRYLQRSSALSPHRGTGFPPR